MGLSAEDSISHSRIRFYRLTHDFLVPAIREWISVARNRLREPDARKLLRDLSANWKRRPGSREKSLPGGFRWLHDSTVLWIAAAGLSDSKQMIATPSAFVLMKSVVASASFLVPLTLHYRSNPRGCFW